MSTLSVDMIEPVGSTLTLGQSGDTITVPSGATFTNSGTATGFGGLIAQVLQHSLNSVISTTSTSYVASGLTQVITPASTSSRILLMCSGGACGNDTNTTRTFMTFYVDGSEVSPAGPYESIEFYFGDKARGPHSMCFIHSPATTSATTYTVYYKAEGTTSYFNDGDSSRVMLTVMELSL